MTSQILCTKGLGLVSISYLMCYDYYDMLIKQDHMRGSAVGLISMTICG